MIANDEGVKTREDLERRLLAFRHRASRGIRLRDDLRSRPSDLPELRGRDDRDEIKQWLRYRDKCRDLLKMVGTEKLVVKLEPGERWVTYDGVVSDITEWLVKGITRPNRTLAMGAALAAAGTLTNRDWALMAVHQILERQEAKGS